MTWYFSKLLLFIKVWEYVNLKKKKGAFRLIVPYNISNVFEMFENNENRGLKSMRQFNKKKNMKICD